MDLSSRRLAANLDLVMNYTRVCGVGVLVPDGLCREGDAGAAERLCPDLCRAKVAASPKLTPTVPRRANTLPSPLFPALLTRPF